MRTMKLFVITFQSLSNYVKLLFFLRELLQDFPALSSLQCVVSAVSLSSAPDSDDSLSQDHNQESSGEDTSRSGLVKVWPTLESSGEDPPTYTQSEVHSSLESGEGTSTCSQPKFRSIITPPETVTWSTAQLVPFVQRLAPGKPIEGKVKFLFFLL